MITVVPANEACWDDLQSVLGTRGDPVNCQCHWYKLRGDAWRATPREERAQRLREQTDPGHPRSRRTSGLVAFLDGEPVGWCAVEPRSEYAGLARTRVAWSGRTEDKADPSVWAVTCFVTRAGYRRQGVMRALEAYPMLTRGQEITWGELHVGSRSVFAAAGFSQVSAPTTRRVVMRIEFRPT